MLELILLIPIPPPYPLFHSVSSLVLREETIPQGVYYPSLPEVRSLVSLRYNCRSRQLFSTLQGVKGPQGGESRESV
jgi:hypothetical protein